jgi:hypothetical protein
MSEHICGHCGQCTISPFYHPACAIERISLLEKEINVKAEWNQKYFDRISLLEKEKALLIKDLRETWDYEDEHIAEVLGGAGQ